MEIKVTHLGNVRFDVKARSHSLVCDQPAENSGDDTGMTPPELLLASLGTCAGFYAVQYLKTRSLADTGVEITVTAEKLKAPARLGNFTIRVQCPVPLSEEHTVGMQRAVEHCLIHNTLLNPPEMKIELEFPK